MNRLPLLFTFTILFVSMSEISQADEGREPKPRFKGVELYSWESPDGTWLFSMLDGTNRLKTAEEVKRKENQIEGVDAAKRALLKLAKGEQVFWVHRLEGFAFPPEESRKKLAAVARGAGISLSIAE